jgi:hypothetical protein
MKLLPLVMVLGVALSACSGLDGVAVMESGQDNSTDGTDNTGTPTDNNSQTPDTDTDTGTDNDTTDDQNNGVADAGSASYRVTFNATWSAETHPLQFPGDPHFSPLVGAVHNEQVEFWTSGQPATDGIEQMAETGGTNLLLDEVNTAIANGYASLAVSGGGIPTSPGTVSVEFEVTTDYPQITLVSMVAPSPDWFVGVHNLSLLQNGAFVDTLTVDLAVYDSGTDSGTRYTSGNIDTEVRDPVTLLTSFPDDSPFINGEPFVGQLVIEKL